MPLVPYFRTRGCRYGDVPDYWFAANGTVMDLVFGTALQEYGQKKFVRKDCGVLHGILAGLIAHKKTTINLPVGRYRYHHMDSEIFRDPLLDPRIRAFWGETRDGNATLAGAAELGRVWEHSLRPGRWASGVDVRVQDQVGIVDFRLRVCPSTR